MERRGVFATLRRAASWPPFPAERYANLVGLRSANCRAAAGQGEARIREQTRCSCACRGRSAHTARALFAHGLGALGWLLAPRAVDTVRATIHVRTSGAAAGAGRRLGWTSFPRDRQDSGRVQRGCRGVLNRTAPDAAAEGGEKLDCRAQAIGTRTRLCARPRPARHRRDGATVGPHALRRTGCGARIFRWVCSARPEWGAAAGTSRLAGRSPGRRGRAATPAAFRPPGAFIIIAAGYGTHGR